MKRTLPHSKITLDFHPATGPIKLPTAAYDDLRRVIAKQLLQPNSYLCEGIKHARRQRCPVISFHLYREAIGGPRVYASVPLKCGNQIIWSSVTT